MPSTPTFRRLALLAFLLLSALPFLTYQTLSLNRHFQRIEKDDSGVPVKIIRLDAGQPIAGIASNLTRLTLTNNYDTPRWFVFPLIVGDTLPGDGLFHVERDTPHIEARKYPEKKSKLRVVDVSFYGKDAPDNSFLAFYLPPQSTVAMENYRFLMREETRTQAFEVWEVEHLRTGKKTPFDQWTSLDLMSSGNVRLLQKAVGPGFYLESRDLNWDDKNDRFQRIIPKEKVAYIEASGIRKLSVKME